MDTQPAFPALTGTDFMVLTTHRRSGDPVHTTVWFAQEGDRVYVTTMNGAGKAKRIRGNEQVIVAPSDRMGNTLGPGQTARARILAPDEYPTALAALPTDSLLS